MDNAPTSAHTPPPSPPPPSLLILSAPPLSAEQIAILTAPPPPFPGPSSSVDLSPLEFLLAIVAVVTIPAMIYTFIFAFGCPSCRRRPDQNSGESSSEPQDGYAVAAAAAAAELRYQKDAHLKEIGGECPVCLSAFADGEKLRQLSACKHSFHADCIDLWLSNHSNCPICRSTVTGAGGKPRPSSSAPARDHDLHQGLPDASALV